MARGILEFLFKTMKTGEGAEQVKKDLEALDKTAGKSQKTFSLVDGIMLGLGQRVADYGMQVLRSIPALVEQGVEAQRTRTALEAYAGGALQAEEMVKALKEATGGGISEMTAMQNATKLLSMGLADNAKEAGKLTDIAVTLGSTMGKGPQQAFEEFTLLLANQSILRLDTFGISAANVRQRMQELADEGIAPTDRQARFLIATMEEAEGKMNALDAAGYQATSSLDRMKAIVDDLKTSLAVTMAEGLLPWIDMTLGYVDAVTQQNLRLVELTGSYEEYAELAAVSVGRLNLLTEAEYENLQAEQERAKALEAGRLAQDGWMVALQNSKKAADEGTAANDALKLSIIALSEAAIAQKAIEALTKAEEEGWITTEDYNEALIRIHMSMLDTPRNQIEASRSLQELTKDFQEGKLTVEEYTGKVIIFGREIKNLPDEKVIKVTVKYGTQGKPDQVLGPGVAGHFQHGGQFILGGPAGADRVPVFFWGTRGETVTVTPAGQAAPPMVTHSNQRMNIYGGLTLQGIDTASGLLEELAGMMV